MLCGLSLAQVPAPTPSVPIGPSQSRPAPTPSFDASVDGIRPNGSGDASSFRRRKARCSTRRWEAWTALHGRRDLAP